MSFDLNFHLHRLLRKEPFFAAFSRRIEKHSDNKIPTAAVAFNRETQRFSLLYNPEFMDSLPDEHKVGVLKHEFYHLILKHLTARLPFDPCREPEKSKTWNVAADLAINSHLVSELPSMACIPGEGPFEDYLPYCTTEAYFKKLLEDKENGTGPYQSGDDGESQEPDSMDDHSAWGSGEDQQDGSVASDIMEEKLRDMTKEAVEEADKNANGWGSVGESIRRELRKMVAVTISPEKVLRHFIKTSVNSDRTTTIRRINRRYPYIHPGYRSNKVSNIAISIDQSGSVSDEMLQTFFSFLNKLSTIATFTVIPFHHDVIEDKVYTWKKGEKRPWTRVCYGGTNFDPPTQYVNKRDFDGHIIITDMQAPKPIASKCQRLWVTTSYYKKYLYFQTREKILAIDV